MFLSAMIFSVWEKTGVLNPPIFGFKCWIVNIIGLNLKNMHLPFIILQIFQAVDMTWNFRKNFINQEEEILVKAMYIRGFTKFGIKVA